VKSKEKYWEMIVGMNKKKGGWKKKN